MLKSYCVSLDCWGGDKIVKEIVTADNPKKASQRARDAVQKRIRAPFDMIRVINVEIVKEKTI